MNFKACKVQAVRHFSRPFSPGRTPSSGGMHALCGKVTKISHTLPTLCDKCFQSVRRKGGLRGEAWQSSTGSRRGLIMRRVIPSTGPGKRSAMPSTIKTSLARVYTEVLHFNLHPSAFNPSAIGLLPMAELLVCFSHLPFSFRHLLLVDRFAFSTFHFQ